jgi:hypothetical protein
MTQRSGSSEPPWDIAVEYRRRLDEVALRGDDREESYYPCLADLLTRYAMASGRRDVHVTTLPRLAAEGAPGRPDFQVWRGRHRIAGYVEAKRPGTPLDPVQGSEQLARYLQAFPSLILTNFREFRLFRRGEQVLSAQLDGATLGGYLGLPGHGHGAAGLYELPRRPCAPSGRRHRGAARG